MRCYLVLVLISLAVVATCTLSSTTAFVPQPQVAPAVLRLGDQVLLGPITYGDTTKFWESHTVVVGTIRESRQEYLPDGKPISREHVGIRVEETVPQRCLSERRMLRISRDRPVVAFDIPADPPPALYRVGTRIMLLVANAAVDDPQKETFELRSYAMMPHGHPEGCFWRVWMKGSSTSPNGSARFFRLTTLPSAWPRFAIS